MIELVQQCTKNVNILFFCEEDGGLKNLPETVQKLFTGEFLQTAWLTKDDGTLTLFVGMGKPGRSKLQLKEIGAKASKECKERKLSEFSADLQKIVEAYEVDAVRHIAEGMLLGIHEQQQFKAEDTQKNYEEEVQMELCLADGKEFEEAKTMLAEILPIVKGICFARDMVNLPGNRLRPADFAGAIQELVKDTEIEAEILDVKQLREKGMTALLGVGESSAYPPCMTILRYHGDPDSTKITGLVGKGVTCDTGGYCLKPANSMLGIKGDMAGGAAVTGAIYALAKNHIKTNAVAVIPMCENRISDGSLLPGDVIGSYAGKTIEVGNTDAEGRLILADAVAYTVKEEHASQILDIATLTGAVVNMFGFTVAGAICDQDEMFARFAKAYENTGERYWRLPFYEEHEKMIESKIADIKNISDGGCGTITAGLFIRAFAQECPWLHLDIAGTAWVDAPIFAFQSAGATGAGVSSIYQFAAEK